MKKNLLIVGVLIIFGFYSFSTEECNSCRGKGSLTRTSKVACEICKGTKTLQCEDYKVLRSRRFINNNLDESYYDCKGGKYRTRSGYADYFNEDGKICDNCNGTGKVECGRCEGYGHKTSSTERPHKTCGGSGKVARYKNWFNKG